MDVVLSNLHLDRDKAAVITSEARVTRSMWLWFVCTTVCSLRVLRQMAAAEGAEGCGGEGLAAESPPWWWMHLVRWAFHSRHFPDILRRGCMCELKCPSQLLQTLAWTFSARKSDPLWEWSTKMERVGVLMTFLTRDGGKTKKLKEYKLRRMKKSGQRCWLWKQMRSKSFWR